MASRTLQEAITRGHGRERPFKCPSHHDRHASASVNVVKGLWVCYTCGAHGTTADVIETEGYEFGREMLEMLDEAEARIYPESWLDLFAGTTTYWQDRGFTDRAISHFKLGFDHSKDWPCYPMRSPAGELLGVTYRNTGFPHNDYPKYLYPKGVVKSDMLFGYEPFASNTVTLCEGALDAVAVWDAGHRAVALYGSMMSKRQLELLHCTGAKKIILALDNDKAGRRAMNGWVTDDGVVKIGLAERLEIAGFETVRPCWEGRDEKDIAEVERDTRKTLLDLAV